MKQLLLAPLIVLTLCGCGDDISFDNITAQIGDETLEINSVRGDMDPVTTTVSLVVAGPTLSRDSSHGCSGHLVDLSIEIPDVALVSIGSRYDVADAPFSLSLGATQGCYRVSETVTGTVTFNSLSGGSAAGIVDVRGTGNGKPFSSEICQDDVPLVLKWDGFETGVHLVDESCDVDD